jgi:SAM-dependent methyltransferase
MTDAPPSPHTPERWGAASRGYADKIAPMLHAYADAIIDRLDVDADSHVLEVAAGSGALTEALFPKVKSLLSIDFAPQMIEILRERLAGLGATNVRTAVMNGMDLRLEDSSFDAAACSFALMLFPDRVQGFSELCRVVRPGGRVAATGWAGPDRFEAFGLFLASIRAAFPDMPSPPSPPPVFSLADPVQFKAEMEAAGLRDVEVDFVTREQEVADFEDAWSFMTAGAPPIQVLFDQVGPAGKERVHEELRRIIDERFGGGPFTLTNVATLGSGRAS